MTLIYAAVQFSGRTSNSNVILLLILLLVLLLHFFSLVQLWYGIPAALMFRCTPLKQLRGSRLSE